MNQHNLKYTEIRHLVLEPKSGSHISNCLRDALKLATKEWCDVVVVHNGRNYKVSINKLLDTIEETSEK